MKTIVALTFLFVPLQASESWFGMMELAPLDTARLSAFCSEEPPADPCDIQFHFHDARGRIVKQSAAILMPGYTGFLDITSSEVGGAAGRVTIIPCFLVGRGRLFGAVRIFDLFTQRQRVLANLADRSAARGGEMHFGVSGITAYDTARINAVCSSDSRDGCEVLLKFHLPGGKVLKETAVSLAPGAGAFLDLRLSETGVGFRPAEIIPCILVGLGGVFATYEMIDTATGFTTLLAYPASALLP